MFELLRRNSKKIDKKDHSKSFTRKDLEVLQNINSLILSEFNSEVLLSQIVNITTKYLGCIGTLFILYNKENKTVYPRIVSDGIISDLAVKLLGNRMDSFEQEVSSNATKSIESFNSKKIIIGNILADFITPPAPLNWSKITQKLYRMKTIISVPVYTSNNEFGVLLYSFKETKKELPERIVELLETYTSQIALAMERSYLFEATKAQVTQLEQKNAETQSLFNLTSEVSKTLDFDQVAQSAVDSLPQNEEIIGGLLSTYDSKSKMIQVKAISTNNLSKQVEKIVGDFSNLTLDLSDPNNSNNPSKEVLATGKPHFSNDLAESISPPIPEKLVGTIQNIINVKSSAEYPIFIRSEVRGTITFYIKSKTIEEIDDNMKRLLSTYSLQIGIALENALLFEQSQRQQRELEEALGKLKDARRRERDMIDVMGHELRTPISIVRNALLILDGERVLKGEISKEKLDKYLDMAIESVRREVTLIETLLASTKLEGNRIQLEYAKVDMIDVVKDSIEAHERSAISKGLEVVFTPPKREIEVYADRVRTQEIMDNFLSNAIKYTAKGKVEINLHADNGLGRVDVKDSGIGISEDDLKNLGKKFFRANQLMQDEANQVHPGGTGLGLYVTFELIKVMGGQKWIHSEPGKGSTFSFAFPIYKGEPVKQFDQTFMGKEK